MSNCLITKTGRTIDCIGGKHETTCKQVLKISLTVFVGKQHNGIRVMIGRDESIAIEFYHKPTDKQISAIRKILRAGDYYRLTLVKKTITSDIRPIRNFKI